MVFRLDIVSSTSECLRYQFAQIKSIDIHYILLYFVNIVIPTFFLPLNSADIEPKFYWKVQLTKTQLRAKFGHGATSRTEVIVIFII